MIYPEADKIEEQVESKYALVILAAKRAKQIKEGARPLIPTDSGNPLTIALDEIADGQLGYTFDEHSLAGREALADREAVVGARELEVEGIDPLAMPDDVDEITRAASALGADLDDDLLGEEEEEEESEDTDEEETEDDEENPLLLADEESDAGEG
jgi:DNA-directed RNA polymerase subunit omega